MSIEKEIQILENFQKSDFNIFKFTSQDYINTDDQVFTQYQKKLIKIKKEFINNFIFTFELLNSKSTVSEKNQLLQQNIYQQSANFEKFGQGLFYCFLLDSLKQQEYVNMCQLLGPDGIKAFTMAAQFVLEHKFLEIQNQYLLQFVNLVELLIKADISQGYDILVILIRNIKHGDYCSFWQEYMISAVKMIYKNIDKLLNQPILPIIFIKLLRMHGSFLYLNSDVVNQDEIKSIILQLLELIWQKKKQECLLLGRELIWVIQEQFKCQELQFMTLDFIKPIFSGNPLYVDLLYNKTKKQSFDQNLAISGLIPTYVQNRLKFIIENIHISQVNRYMDILRQKCEIHRDSLTQFVYVDMLRHIIKCYQLDPNFMDNRFIVIQYLFMNSKQNLVGVFLKQALFFDWLYFVKGQEHFKTFQPGVELILYNLQEKITFSEELIEFLVQYSKEYDPQYSSKNVLSIKRVFECLIEQRIISDLELIFQNHDISEVLRHSLNQIMNVNDSRDDVFNTEQEINQINLNEDINDNGVQCIQNIEQTDEIHMNEYVIDFDIGSEVSNDIVLNQLDGMIEVSEYDPMGDTPRDFNLEQDQFLINDAFKQKFGSTLTNFLYNPDSQSFFLFLDQYLLFNNASQDIKKNHIFQEEMAKVILNIYQNHFSQFTSGQQSISGQLLKFQLQQQQNNRVNYIRIENLMKTIRNLYKNFTAHLLFYIVDQYKEDKDAQSQLLLDIYIQTFNQGTNKIEAKHQQVLHDIKIIYSNVTQESFQYFIIQIFKHFNGIIQDNCELIYLICQTVNSECTNMIESILYLKTQDLWKLKLDLLIQQSLLTPYYAQKQLFQLINAQTHSKKNNQFHQVFMTFLNIVQNSTKNDLELINGLRTICLNYLLYSQDEKNKMNTLQKLLEFDIEKKQFLFSIIIKLDNELVKKTLKKFINDQQDNYLKMEQLLNHMCFWKSNNYQLSDHMFIDALLKSSINKVVQKLNLDHIFKEMLD